MIGKEFALQIGIQKLLIITIVHITEVEIVLAVKAAVIAATTGFLL